MALSTSAKSVALACVIAVVLATGAALWLGWFGGRHVLHGRLVDYHKIYDTFWDVACDTAMDGSDRGCYIQYVDVYRPRPEFAAAMVEVVVHAGDDGLPDPHVRFDIEPGLSFRDTTVSVEIPGGVTALDVSHCASNTCRFSGADGRAILESWRDGTALILTIDEGRDGPTSRSWPLENMAMILNDFTAQRRARNLP